MKDDAPGWAYGILVALLVLVMLAAAGLLLSPAIALAWRMLVAR